LVFNHCISLGSLGSDVRIVGRFARPALDPAGPGGHTTIVPASNHIPSTLPVRYPKGVFPMSRFLLSAVAVGLVAGLTPGADPSPAPGTPVTPFHPLNVNGPAAGEKACPV
jgi:hypothetical protein